MMPENSVWKNEELAVFRLRSLYRDHGYTPYKMSKFEEYDLYARNKHFLVSENIITFTDTNGKLMALKPDVTLSIIKNTKDGEGGVQKLYYDENVYRVSKGTKAFGELTQVGLECIGEVDDHCICEVLSLAADSLAAISEDYVLDISDLGLLAPIFKGLGISEAAKDELLQCIAEKNAHGINEVAAREKAAPGALSKLRALLACGGALETAIPALERVLPECREQIARLSCIKDVLGEKRAKKVRLDFSVVNDMSYYNGIVFKGFINGVPAGVLSGGQYDGMMQKMGRSSKAIGFAVYLDLLERFGITAPEYDVDAVILYDDACDAVKLFRAAQQLICENKRVTVLKKLPEDLKYKQLLCMKEGEVCVLETNA